MTSHAWWLLGAYLVALLLFVRPLGLYIADLLEGRGIASRLRPIEAPLYRWCGIRADLEMGWLHYTLAIVLFNGLGVLAVYGLQRLQFWLPLNPQGFANVASDSAFNTAVSFVTNTNWQGYAGESTLSHLTQMLALTVQNFLSAATGICVAVALMRGLARHATANLGNAWVDLTRITLFLLLPMAIGLALFLVSQGVIQNFAADLGLTTIEGTPQTLAMGPVASQEAIKMLGTNGGGFFNANSAHPFENPTPLTNFVQMWAIFLIPGALCLTFGRVVGDLRQGWALLAAMTLLFVALAIAIMHFESQSNPLLGLAANAGNLEGKELRFGSADSALFATITTLASCGAVDAMHDSLLPMGGLITFAGMMLGEVVFGGVGSGLYGMLVFAILAVFIAGLMIGRTPEYLGKKIEAYEMKMVALAILVTPILVLAGTAVAVLVPDAIASTANPGAHGYAEILYAFTSAANNNGSAFAGLSANTPFYNNMLGGVMVLGRFGVIVPVLALAGALAAKKRLSVSAGSMPTHGPLFVVLLIGTVILVGALNYVPALALGPVIEQLLLFPR